MRCFLAGFMLALISLGCGSAATVNIGFLSFERSSPVEGVNSFLVANLTGPEGCNSDFPLCNSLYFLAPELTVMYLDAGLPVYVTRSLTTSLSPGFHLNSELAFSNQYELQMARLTARISGLFGTLYDGTRIYTPGATLDISLGLETDEFAPITIELEPAPVVPETTGTALPGLALLLILAVSRRALQGRSTHILLLPFCLLMVESLAAQVQLSAILPKSALIGSTITLIGSGFPSGTIRPDNVDILIEPAFRFTSDPPRRLAPSSITQIVGSTHRIRFVVPVGFNTTPNVVEGYSVAIRGRTDAGQEFMSHDHVQLTIFHRVTALGVTPASGRAGTSVLATLDAIGFPWIPGITTFATEPDIGLRRSPLQGGLPNGVEIVVPQTARLGTHFIVAATGIHQLRFSFEVLRADAWIQYARPRDAEMGRTLDVSLQGVGTHWVQGSTWVDFGAEITINSVAIHNETSVTANITIEPAIDSGSRTISISTGNDRVYLPDAFTVRPSQDATISLSPTSARPGETVYIEVRGTNTHFKSGVTAATMGPGIEIGRVDVLSPTLVRFTATVGLKVIPALRGLALFTRSELALGSFEIAYP